MLLWYPALDFMDTSFTYFFTPEMQTFFTDNGYLGEEGFKFGPEFREQILEVTVYKQVAKIICPTLFLHGDKDEEVPCQQSKKAFDLVKGEKEIHIVKGAEHCFPGYHDEAIEKTLAFLKKYF